MRPNRRGPSARCASAPASDKSRILRHPFVPDVPSAPPNVSHPEPPEGTHRGGYLRRRRRVGMGAWVEPRPP